METPIIKRIITIEKENEIFSAELEARGRYFGYPDFSVNIDSLKHLIHSETLGYDIDATHELYINADKRNYVIGLLREKCIEEWLLSKSVI